ncbi:MAG TPA: tetratricopeptide repeat protein, partial [Myxococcota bacterium]|nr:tetratricopeptide repeat protein [Myxococcota bacterium]
MAAPAPAPAPEPTDDAGLFHAAAEAARDDDPPRAIALYTALLARFPASPLVASARYNRGLLLEGAADLEAAARDYRAIVDEASPDAPEHTWIDAHYRL